MTQIIDFSADGSKTWIRVANFAQSMTFPILVAYDQVDTYVITCGSLAGTDDDWIFKSTNDGVSFVRVTGITGITMEGKTPQWITYGLGKLWMSGEVSFGDGGVIWSSTDDGSTWVEEWDGETDGGRIGTFAISGSGMIAADKESSLTHGFFDADGVSLPASMTSDFFGLGSSWSPHGFSPRFLFADPDSVKPNRFFAAFYNSTSDLTQMVYSDDNGTTWERAKLLEQLSDGLGNAVATDMLMFWDGANYHWICTGTTDYWMWSKTGEVWTPAPVRVQGLAEITGNLSAVYDRVACLQKTE